MNHLLNFDEINRFSDELGLTTYPDENGILRTRKDKRDVIDEIWDLLIMAYLYGNEAVNDEFGFNVDPDYGLLDEALNLRIDGKTTKDRLSEYIDLGDYEAIRKVIETESHRMYNKGIIDTAEAAPPTGSVLMKRWNTMLDDRVRLTHDFLEGVTVPLGSEFATIDGDKAQYPGGFSKAENNVNCRCVLDIVSA